MSQTMLDLFWKNVMPCPNTGCWYWTGLTLKGYGEAGEAGIRVRNRGVVDFDTDEDP